MKKRIDLSKSVYELCRDDKNITGIMKTLGFDQITDPAMLNTVGRFMTIPKGAVLKKISMDDVKRVFDENGYELVNGKDEQDEN